MINTKLITIKGKDVWIAVVIILGGVVGALLAVSGITQSIAATLLIPSFVLALILLLRYYRFTIPLYLFFIVALPYSHWFSEKYLEELGREVPLYSSIIACTFLRKWVGFTPYFWDLFFIVIAVVSFNRLRVSQGSVFTLLIMLYAYFMINLLTGLTTGASAKEVLGDFRFAFYYLPLFLLTYSWFKPSLSKMVIYTIGIGLLVHLILSIWLQFNVTQLPRSGGQNSFFAVLGLSLALIFLSQKDLKYKKRILWSVSMIITSLLISMICQSRTLWLAMGLTIIIYLGYQLRNVREFKIGLKVITTLVSVIIILLAIVIPLLTPLIYGRMFVMLRSSLSARIERLKMPMEDSSMKMHIGDFKNAVKLIEQSPFLGYGFGTKIPLYQGIGGRREPEGRFVDNAWLTLWVKAGIIGVVLFGLLWGFHIRNLFAILRWPRFKYVDVYFRVLISSYAISIPGFFLTSIFTANFTHWVSTIALVAIFMGIIEKFRVLSKNHRFIPK